MKRTLIGLGVSGLLLTACGSSSGGGGAPPRFDAYTANGFPVVAGVYTFTYRETANSCDPVDSTPSTSTITLSQTEDQLAAIDSSEAADIAALEAAGWTITANSGLQGTVTIDGHFSLSQGVTFTHATLGTTHGTHTVDGRFTPTSGSGTTDTLFVYSTGSVCTSKGSIAGTKNP